MNKKAKTKARKADEDANLDEALDESFPASDPPSMTQPRTGADVTQENRRDTRGEKRSTAAKGEPRARASQPIRDHSESWRARARIPISAVLLSHMRASRDRIRVQADYGSPGRKPKQMIPHLIGFFIPSYLILSADFELKRPPTGVMLCSQPAGLFNGELRWRKVKFVVTVKPRSRKRRSRRSRSPPPRS